MTQGLPAVAAEATATETIAVVVVSYNCAGDLPDFVASLDKGLAGLSWHLTMADNASADDTVATMRRLAPAATVVETGRNGGYAFGINAAYAAAAPHTAVLLLNPDVRLGPGCVQALLAALRTPGTGLAVPRITNGDGELIFTLRREPTVARAFGDAFMGALRAGRFPRLGEVVVDPRRYEAGTTSDWAEGSAMLVSQECWQRCGPWDESFFLYSEETDFALRARDAGFATRFVPQAQAVHLEGESRASPPLWALLVVNRVRLFHKRHNAVHTALYWLAIFLRELSRAALGHAISKAAVVALLSTRRFRELPGPHSIGR